MRGARPGLSRLICAVPGTHDPRIPSAPTHTHPPAHPSRFAPFCFAPYRRRAAPGKESVQWQVDTAGSWP
ncbi:hypothetical protein GCM10023194_50520 [Planotetraspora phitsanulokensis]